MTEGNVRFKISSLEDLGYTFQKPEESVPSERIDFSIESNFSIDGDKSKITFVLNPKFTTGKREPKLIAELIFKVEFHVEGLKNVIEEEGDDITLPNQLVVTLFSISYSTMRGVFFEKSRGTMAERLIIPIIDPKVILKMEKEKN